MVFAGSRPAHPFELTTSKELPSGRASRSGRGDILCVRSGWYQHVLEGNLGTYMQQAVPGIELSCCEWLHDHEVAALASDTYSAEVKPSGQVGVTNPVHAVLIRDLGMTIGEIFNFEALAADCAERRYLGVPFCRATAETDARFRFAPHAARGEIAVNFAFRPEQ